MEQEFAVNQGQVVVEFMLFLNDILNRTSHHFENKTLCSREEANVIRVINEHGSLMVKDIGQALPQMDPSKLTRLIDGLEKQAYVTRAINLTDRRSFIITVTESGTQLLKKFTEDLYVLAQAMLAPLTPTERLILVDLFNKIQSSSIQPDGPQMP